MTSVDLKELVVDRSDSRRRSNSSWLTRYLLPGGLVLGFLLLAFWSLEGSFAKPIAVTVVPVLSMTSAAVSVDTPLFRAAGWIEPRPTPTFVTAIAEGIVEQLLVIEGQEVQAGEPVAQLVKRDAELAVENADADLSLKKANVGSALAHLDAAKTYWNEPIERMAALAEAEATLAKVRTDLSRIPAAITAAEAKLVQSKKEFESKSASESAIPKIVVERVRSEIAVATASIEELKAQEAALQNEVAALSKRREVLRRQLELKVEEERRLKDADAQHQAAVARVRQAEAVLNGARLRLERMTVRAPITGRVLALIAKPGSRLMGIERASLTDASTVISMYDPKRLQIRADVRLENVPLVSPGQSVRIETPAIKHSIMGRVLTLTSLTDIQKNTLQVKIELQEPPAVLKPDMLVEATFLAPPTSLEEPLASESIRLSVPDDLIDSTTSTPHIWVADIATSMARYKPIQVGRPLADGWIEVNQGLSVGDRVIAGGRERLTANARIQIRGEANTMAASPHGNPAQHQKPLQRLH